MKNKRNEPKDLNVCRKKESPDEECLGCKYWKSTIKYQNEGNKMYAVTSQSCQRLLHVCPTCNSFIDERIHLSREDSARNGKFVRGKFACWLCHGEFDHKELNHVDVQDSVSDILGLQEPQFKVVRVEELPQTTRKEHNLSGGGIALRVSNKNSTAKSSVRVLNDDEQIEVINKLLEKVDTRNSLIDYLKNEKHIQVFHKK